MFVKDNATCHKSKKVMGFLAASGVALLDWPPLSPDLSPIENLWAELKRRVDATRPQTVAELETRSKATWLAIQRDTALIGRMVDSMPSRLREVVARKGGKTHY